RIGFPSLAAFSRASQIETSQGILSKSSSPAHGRMALSSAANSASVMIAGGATGSGFFFGLAYSPNATRAATAGRKPGKKRVQRQHMVRLGLVLFVHLLPAVSRVADELVFLHVDDEIEPFERDLPDQYRCPIRDFHDVDSTISTLDRELNGVVD